jgi:hypothetical protein
MFLGGSENVGERIADLVGEGQTSSGLKMAFHKFSLGPKLRLHETVHRSGCLRQKASGKNWLWSQNQ